MIWIRMIHLIQNVRNQLCKFGKRNGTLNGTKSMFRGLYITMSKGFGSVMQLIAKVRNL